MSANEHLALVAACFGCGDEAARLLAAAMAERQFAHRAAIAHRGDPSNSLYLIIEGAVATEIYGIEGQQAQLARHGPGEIFGAFPEPTSYRADIVAIGSTRLLSIAVGQLTALMADHADIATGVALLLGRQLDLLLDRMAARIGLSATGRFYRALLNLANADGVISPAPVVAAVALSVHTTRETASRALGALVRRGIVERQPDALRIASRRMLEEMVV